MISCSSLCLRVSLVAMFLCAQSLAKWGPDCGRHAVVGSLLFLRLICPALISPEGWEITGKITRETRRGLILMSKIIQALANGTKTKE
jgi:GTPase-activator protein for Ras-like GTPase